MSITCFNFSWSIENLLVLQWSFEELLKEYGSYEQYDIFVWYIWECYEK